LINLFPNPTIDKLSINFICPTAEEVIIELSDLSGKNISNYQINCKAGYNQFEISTAQLNSGTYICKLNYKGNAKSLLFIKLKQ
jgi:hypothetical protein